MRRRGQPSGASHETPPNHRILPDRLAHVAPVAGVYLLLDSAGACVYVGQSVNVSRRIGAHHLVDYDIARMIPTSSLRARLLLEARLIRELQPRCNTYSGNIGAIFSRPTSDAENLAAIEAFIGKCAA